MNARASAITWRYWSLQYVFLQLLPLVIILSQFLAGLCCCLLKEGTSSVKLTVSFLDTSAGGSSTCWSLTCLRGSVKTICWVKCGLFATLLHLHVTTINDPGACHLLFKYANSILDEFFIAYCVPHGWYCIICAVSNTSIFCFFRFYQMVHLTIFYLYEILVVMSLSVPLPLLDLASCVSSTLISSRWALTCLLDSIIDVYY